MTPKRRRCNIHIRKKRGDVVILHCPEEKEGGTAFGHMKREKGEC